jgi:hypothetical protein
MAEEIITSLRDVLILLLGAFIGALASVTIWRLQAREDRKRKRAELLLRAIQLTTSASTHTRCLIYSKADVINSTVNLPDNTVDEAMSIILIHFSEAYPLVKQLHLQQQELFAFHPNSPDDAHLMVGMGKKMAETMTEIVKCLRNIAEREKLTS